MSKVESVNSKFVIDVIYKKHDNKPVVGKRVEYLLEGDVPIRTTDSSVFDSVEDTDDVLFLLIPSTIEGEYDCFSIENDCNASNYQSLCPEGICEPVNIAENLSFTYSGRPGESQVELETDVVNMCIEASSGDKFVLNVVSFRENVLNFVRTGSIAPEVMLLQNSNGQYNLIIKSQSGFGAPGSTIASQCHALRHSYSLWSRVRKTLLGCP